MFEAINTIATLITIVEKVYSGGKLVQRRVQKWKPPSPKKITDSGFSFGVEYHEFTKESVDWREFILGKQKFREEQRLLHNRSKLIELYPGLIAELLRDNRLGIVPYQVLSTELEKIQLLTQDTEYNVKANLIDVYNATRQGLEERYRQIGIQYSPFVLARAHDWNSSPSNRLTVERVNYTDVASTNLIADLDIPKALGKTGLVLQPISDRMINLSQRLLVRSLHSINLI
jgi:hypothetical protein